MRYTERIMHGVVWCVCLLNVRLTPACMLVPSIERGFDDFDKAYYTLFIDGSGSK